MGGLFVALLIGEIVVLKSGKDLLHLVPYLGDANPEVHQVLDPKSGRLFGLKKNSTQLYPNNGASAYRVSINRHGFRNEELSANKQIGSFRIVVFGGSNTYGALTDQHNTYPKQLEVELNRILPFKVEVWNGGTSAYNLYQKIAFASETLTLLKPDLILIQHFINYGRRPFFKGTEYLEYFRQDSDLYSENFPFLMSENPNPPLFHSFLVVRSSIYRLILGQLQSSYLARKDFASFSKQHYLNAGEHSAEEKFKQLIKKFDKQKVLFFDPLDRYPKNHYLGIPVLKLKNRPVAPKYLEVHPPADVYSWYAQELATELIEKRLVR